MDSDGPEAPISPPRRPPRARFAHWAALLATAILASALPVTAVAQETSADAIRGELRAGKFPDAERHARTLLASTERLHGADSRETADVLDLLSEAMRKEGKSHDPEALSVCLRALAIRERLLPADDPSIAVSLENLGGLHLANGDLDKARPPLERALAIRTRALGPRHPDVAWSLIWLANLELSAAREDTARVLVERAVAIQDSTLRDDDPKRTQGLEMLAGMEYHRGEYREAAALYEQILGLRLASLGLEHVQTASALHNLGAVLSEMGDYAEGRRYLEQARAVMRRVLSAQDPMVVKTVYGLGLVREKQGDPEGALALYREAARLQRKAFGPDHPDYAWYLMSAGGLELQLGHRSAARKALLEALRIQERALGPKHPELAYTLRELAETDAEGGSVDLALERGGRALEIQERSLGSSHPDLVPTLVGLARFHALKGDTAGAFDLALRASQIRTDHLRLTSGGLSERQALAYAAVGPTGLDVALGLVAAPGANERPTSVRRTWEAVAQTRTLVLDEMAARHRASVEDTSSDATAAAARALREARQRLANLLVRGSIDDTPERYQALLRTARLEMERAERELGTRSRLAPTMTPSNLQRVLGAMPAGWGIVSYASYRADGKRQYLAFVRGEAGEPVAVPIGDADRIDELVNQWTRNIVASSQPDTRASGRAEDAARQAGRSLRAAVWDRVREALGRVDGVLIIPDGSLHGINFGALPEENASYVVEGVPVLHYVTSEFDISTSRSRTPHGAGLLAFGGVDFGAESTPRSRSDTGRESAENEDTNCGSFYDANFAPLPQSRAEVEEIARAWGDSTHATVMTGSQATEDAFKRLAPGRRVLHLATHGFFLNPSRCLQELAGSRGIGGLEIAVRPKPVLSFDQQSPLLLSGLALAAANRRSEATPHEEDGILTAEEVASLDLRGVEWAVLSACDTGVSVGGQGEGILGLRRAFRTAGVATLVISLWPVQDEAAREWMRALYQNRFHDGVDTAHAVRAATIEVLRSRRAQGRSTSPFYWAAFVAAGDWN